jgi:glycosyltransferase involved in cell wall biosynthesis
MRELAIKERICAPEKIQVIGNGSSNGFDTEAYTPPSTAERCLSRERLGIPRQALVVGYVGRIVKEKGLDELVAAWADLRNEYSQLYLLVVGPEEGQDPVAQHTLRVLHSDSRIRMTGLVPNARPYLAAMDVLTLPSYREGLPNAPLEAAASGLPVVVTNVPGCTDAVLDQRTGILIPPYDSEALADALRKYLDSPALRMEHGLAGRERVRSSFAQEVVWSELLARYHR